MERDPATRILLVAEELSRQPDEAALATLSKLARYCERRFETLVLHCRGEAPEGLTAKRVRFTRAGITPALWNAARAWAPDLALYVPSASITANAFYRARWLRLAARSPVAVLGLQRRRLSGWGRQVAAAFEPDALIVNSEATAEPFRELGWSIVLMDLGVDPDRFRPLPEMERLQVQDEMGWTDDRPVVLHVGHLRAGRGLDALVDLASDGRYRVVMVASVSEGGEEHLATRLESGGVEVHHGYVAEIERYYQASDLYLFPVSNETSAVDFPLSVLEALACGCQVLTTPHGALPERLGDLDAVHWLDPGRSLVDQVDSCLRTDRDPGSLAPSFGWDAVFDRLIADLEGVLS